MSTTDPISDLLARIRNALLAKHDRLDVPSSKLKLEVCKLLKDEGFIRNYRHIEGPLAGTVRIFLRYAADGTPAISSLRRISKPGRRDPLDLAGAGLGPPGTGARDRRRADLRALVKVRRSSVSRIGRMPIAVPSGTRVAVEDGVFTAEGPKGKVSQSVFEGFPIEVDNGTITISRPGDAGPERAKHGLLRALLANAVQGASAGFTKELDIVGVGYRAEVKGRQVQFALGYSHPVLFDIPEGINITIDAK